MKKFITARNAHIAGWVGSAMLIASIFVPKGWADFTLSTLGFLLCLFSIGAGWYFRGYDEGYVQGYEDMGVFVREELRKTPTITFQAKTFREGRDG